MMMTFRLDWTVFDDDDDMFIFAFVFSAVDDQGLEMGWFLAQASLI